MSNNLWLQNDVPVSIKDEYDEEMSHLSLKASIAAGLMVSLALFIIVLEVVLFTGANLDVIGQAFMRLFTQSEIPINAAGVFLGSVIHIGISALFGFLFAYTMPYFPRAFWVVVGEIYGILMGVLACLILAPIIESVCQDGCANRFMIMWINVLYGTFLGIAAATYGLKWSFPRWLNWNRQHSTSE
jgi:uncharacterized membrane protein YagU involved in acid resistance